MQRATHLDLGYLHEVAGNDPAIMREIIDVFLEHAPALIGELRRMQDERDGAGMRRVAHKLKPMLAYVGMTALHGRALEVENADLAAMEWGHIEDLVRPLCSEFDAARAALAEFRATIAAQ